VHSASLESDAMKHAATASVYVVHYAERKVPMSMSLRVSVLR
jgi:hypothetical protein